MRLLLIRHAETKHNRESRVQGRADNPLSELGQRQAVALAGYLRREPLRAVISSPLMRARATAAAIAAAHDLAVVEVPDLVEMHVGEMEGLATVEMRDRFPDFLKEWVTERGPSLQMPGGESLKQVQERAWSAVERIREAYVEDGDVVALVSHNFVIGSLITRALDMPLHDFRRFRLSVCGATTLRFRRDRTVLVQLNDTCHLSHAGLPSTDPWPYTRKET